MSDPLNRSIRLKARAAIIEDDHILLIEYAAGWRPHFNLPGGSVEPGESLLDGLKRELWEEAFAEAESERLVLVCDFNAHHSQYQSQTPHTIEFIFACRLANRNKPRLPDRPDSHQVGVRWIPIHDLPTIPLRPKIGDKLLMAISRPGNEVVFVENPAFR